MRNPYRNIIKKEDLIYNPTQTVSDGFENGLSIAAGDRELAKQMFQAAAEIQNSEDELRRTIVKQQNEVLLLNARNKLSLINQEAFVNLQNDPEQFKLTTNEQAADVINELPLLLRGQAKAEFAQEQAGYYYRARNNQREYLDKQKFEQLQVKNKNLAKVAELAIKNIFSLNEGSQAQGLKDLGTAIVDFESSLVEQSGLNTDLFSEKAKYAERQGFYGSVFEQFAKLKLSSFSDPIDAKIFIDEIQNGTAQITYVDPLTKTESTIPSLILDQKTRNAISKGLNGRLEENIKLLKDAQAEQFVRDAVEGKVYLDPKDKTNREAVDKYYTKYIAPNISLNDPTGSLIKISSFLKKTKVMPRPLESMIRGFLASDDFMAVAFASDVVKAIKVNCPELTDYLSNKDIRVAERINELTQEGISPEDAFNTVKNSFSVTDEVRELRTKMFNKELNDGTNKALFDAAIMEEGWFFKENKKPLDLVATQFFNEFVDLAREDFVSGASFTAANNSGLTIIKKTWGNSVVNGDNTLTKHPPEKFYGIDGKKMRELMLAWVEDNVPQETRKRFPDIKKFIVLADRETYATAGTPTSKPSYALCYIQDNGAVVPVLAPDNSVYRIGLNAWNFDNLIAHEKKIFDNKNNGKRIRRQPSFVDPIEAAYRKWQNDKKQSETK